MQGGDFGARLLLLAEGTIRELCTVAPPQLGLGVVRGTAWPDAADWSYDLES